MRRRLRALNEKIMITDEDRAAIQRTLEGRTGCDCTEFLREELRRAEVVPEDQMDREIVTLNSKVVVGDQKAGIELVMTLVLPEYAHLATGYVSVISPVGVATLGRSEGGSFDWQCASSGESGVFTVKKVLFQPEAENRICVAS